MTTGEKTSARRSPRPEVAAAAAQAAVEMYEYSGRVVPEWLREVAAGREVSAPPTGHD